MYGGVDVNYILVLVTHVCKITYHDRCGCGVSGSSALLFLNMMVVGLDLFLCEVKEDHDSGGINPAKFITNSIGCLASTFVRYDANNNIQDAFDIQGAKENILARVKCRDRRKDFYLCIVNKSVILCSK